MAARFKLMVVDVDGTLFDPSRELTQEVRAVVREAMGTGVRFSLATGRLYPSARIIASELGLSGGVICNGGAVVLDVDTGAHLRHLRLPADLSLEVLDETADLGAMRYVFIGESILTDASGPETDAYSKSLRVPMQLCADLRSSVAQAMTPKPRTSPTMIVLRVQPERTVALRERLSARFGEGLLVTSTMEHFVDFMHPDATKAKALSFLAGIYGIKREEIVAVGDGINDLDMLDYAGLGVVVANAAPHVKERADYVTDAPYFMGVLEVVHRFLQ